MAPLAFPTHAYHIAHQMSWCTIKTLQEFSKKTFCIGKCPNFLNQSLVHDNWKQQFWAVLGSTNACEFPGLDPMAQEAPSNPTVLGNALFGNNQ